MRRAFSSLSYDEVKSIVNCILFDGPEPLRFAFCDHYLLEVFSLQKVNSSFRFATYFSMIFWKETINILSYRSIQRLANLTGYEMKIMRVRYNFIALQYYKWGFFARILGQFFSKISAADVSRFYFSGVHLILKGIEN